MTASEKAKEWLDRSEYELNASGMVIVEAHQIITALLADNERWKIDYTAYWNGSQDIIERNRTRAEASEQRVNDLQSDLRVLAEAVLDAHRLDDDGYLQHGHTCTACEIAKRYTESGGE